ncbi:MAG: hypothetical protein GY754_01360 [bacterium]|nr:hypothetical protein [bacterium]
MNSQKKTVFIIFSIFILTVLLTGTWACKQKSSSHASGPNVIHVSDIHFNPFYDPSLLSTLQKADAYQWEKVFSGSKVAGFGAYHKNETNFNLLVSSLKNMTRVQKKPDFVIFTGDFLAHDFHDKYKKHFKNTDRLHEFIKKTVVFLSVTIKKHFPGSPVYFSLGNNDSYSGDYNIIPGGAFLRDTTPVFSIHFLSDPLNRQAFKKTYPVGGYYSALVPGSSGNRIIALNSILFSVKHTGNAPAAEAQLAWFEDQLKSAQKNNEKVWVLLHIPPGVNVFSSIHDKKFVSMWKPVYNERFIGLLKQFAPVIGASFAGHTHMDNFRILADGNKGLAFVRIAPSVTPEFGNNPGFELLTYDRKSFSVVDYGIYYLDLREPFSGTDVSWKKEYGFNKTYGQDSLSAGSLLKVYSAIKSDPSARENYINYYNVNHRDQPALNEKNWKTFLCGTRFWREEGFKKCAGF